MNLSNLETYKLKVKSYAIESSDYSVTILKGATSRVSQYINEQPTLKYLVSLKWDVTRSIRAIFYFSMILGSATYTSFHSFIGIHHAANRSEELDGSTRLGVSRLDLLATNRTKDLLDEGKNAPLPPIPTLPTCKSLMQDNDSPFHNGDFLTRKTMPVSWKPRADHSRELQHSMCQLHRYSADEARQCLAGKHINMIGDSLTRYQYLSLAYFIHKGRYPPRFERSWRGPCPHKDENGIPACSPTEEPNVCMEDDWIWNFELQQDGTDSWTRLMQSMGNSRYFDGFMESNAIRYTAAPFETIVENYFYASPPTNGPTNKNNNGGGQEQASASSPGKPNRVLLSYNQELGWNHEPTPIHGFVYTGCAYHGACTYSDELVTERLKRSANMSFDFSQPLEEAIAPNGILRNVLPPVDIALYNRGLWGPLERGRAETIFPLLYNFSKGEQGRCYFRATNPRFDMPLPLEPVDIRNAALFNGCGYIDHAHLVEDFSQMVFKFPEAPGQQYGNVQDERKFIYMDAVHFKPWVYEELNNMLLNILCNNV